MAAGAIPSRPWWHREATGHREPLDQLLYEALKLMVAMDLLWLEVVGGEAFLLMLEAVGLMLPKAAKAKDGMLFLRGGRGRLEGGIAAIEWAELGWGFLLRHVCSEGHSLLSAVSVPYLVIPGLPVVTDLEDTCCKVRATDTPLTCTLLVHGYMVAWSEVCVSSPGAVTVLDASPR